MKLRQVAIVGILVCVGVYAMLAGVVVVDALSTYFYRSPDDRGIAFGDGDDYEMEYDSGDNRLETRAASTLLRDDTATRSRFFQWLSAYNTGTLGVIPQTTITPGDGRVTLDMVDSGNTTARITNSGAGTASLTVDGTITSDGDLHVGGDLTVDGESPGGDLQALILPALGYLEYGAAVTDPENPDPLGFLAFIEMEGGEEGEGEGEGEDASVAWLLGALASDGSTLASPFIQAFPGDGIVLTPYGEGESLYVDMSASIDGNLSVRGDYYQNGELLDLGLDLGGFGDITGSQCEGCLEYVDTGTEAIPDGTCSPPALMGVTVTCDVEITSLSVEVTLEHDDLSELAVEIASPLGTIVPLVAAGNAAGTNMTGTVFCDDASTAMLGHGASPYTAVFKPVATYALSSIYGEDSAGAWSLAVCDSTGGGDTGNLLGFKLFINCDACYNGEGDADDDGAVTMSVLHGGTLTPAARFDGDGIELNDLDDTGRVELGVSTHASGGFDRTRLTLRALDGDVMRNVCTWQTGPASHWSQFQMADTFILGYLGGTSDTIDWDIDLAYYPGGRIFLSGYHDHDLWPSGSLNWKSNNGTIYVMSTDSPSGMDDLTILSGGVDCIHIDKATHDVTIGTDLYSTDDIGLGRSSVTNGKITFGSDADVSIHNETADTRLDVVAAAGLYVSDSIGIGTHGDNEGTVSFGTDGDVYLCNGTADTRLDIVAPGSTHFTGDVYVANNQYNTGNLTVAGAFLPRQVNDGGMAATNGTEGEIVYNQSDSKFYGCTVTGTPATWAALN